MAKRVLPTADEQAGLAARAQAGDTGAADALLRAVEPLLSRLARRYAFDFGHPDWEVLKAEAMVQVFRGIRYYRSERGTFVGWAATCGGRAVSALCKRQYDRPEVQHRDGLTRDGGEPAAQATRSPLADRVAAAVQALPPLERRVIEVWSEYATPRAVSRRAAARLIGVRTPKLDALLARAKGRLRDALANEATAD